MSKKLTLYVTALDFEELAKFFNITRGFRYIDIDNVIKVSNLKLSKESHRFILNEEIQKTFEKYYRYSTLNCKGIIYKNSKMTADTIKALKELEGVERIILVDYWSKPPLKPELFACEELDAVIQI